MRLIDADALMRAMYERAFETDGDTMWQSGCWVRYRAIEEVVKEQPTIEPRKGRWKGEGLGDYRCSLCGEIHTRTRTNFCPNCGAQMTE